jgi:hypothetical protein
VEGEVVGSSPIRCMCNFGERGRERERDRGVKFIISNLNNNVNMQCKLQKMFFLSYHKPEIPESKVLLSHSKMSYAT